MLPANRFGFADGFNGFQLKITREVTTLIVFAVFAVFVSERTFPLEIPGEFCANIGSDLFCIKKIMSEIKLVKNRQTGFGVLLITTNLSDRSRLD